MKINVRQAALFFGSVFLFKPAYLGELAFWDAFFNVGILLTLIVVAIFWLLKREVSREIILVCTFFLVLLVTTLVHNGNLWSLGVEAIKILGICIMLDISKDEIVPLLNSWAFLFQILIVINLLTILFVPEGLYRNIIDGLPSYLLGHKNAAAVRSFAMIVFVLLRSVVIQKKVQVLDWLFVVLTYLGILLVWSATSIVAYTLFVFFLMFMHREKITRIINIWVMIFISITISVLFVVFRIQNYFSFIIEDILHKSLTFTGRVRIWDNALLYFAGSPWIGWGIENMEVVMSKLILTSAHNAWLDILYKGGVALFLILLIFIIRAARKIEQYHNTSISKLLRYAIYYFLVYFIIENIYGNSMDLFFCTLIIACNLKTIIAQSDQIQSYRSNNARLTALGVPTRNA